MNLINPYISFPAAAGGYAAEVLADDPLGYWRFEETSGATVPDQSGNGHTATIVGANLDVAGPGDLGSAVSTDGTDDYLDLTTLGDFGQSFATGATIEFWYDGATKNYLLGTINDGTSVLLDFSGTTLRWRNAIGGAPSSLTSIDNPSGWNHAVLRFSSAGLNARVNKVDQGTTSVTISSANFGYPLVFGAWNNRGVKENFSQATFDEIAVYDKYLSDERADAHYDAAGVA